jgi:hypothetical protein
VAQAVVTYAGTATAVERAVAWLAEEHGEESTDPRRLLSGLILVYIIAQGQQTGEAGEPRAAHMVSHMGLLGTPFS